MTISLLLILLALLFTASSPTGKFPLWAAVLCLVLERLLAVVPPR